MSIRDCNSTAFGLVCAWREMSWLAFWQGLNDYGHDIMTGSRFGSDDQAWKGFATL